MSQGPTFPDLLPTSRVMAPGDFASKTFRSQSGIEARVQYGNKATDKSLDLEFNAITEASAAQIHDHYQACNGTLFTFWMSIKPLAGNPAFHQGDDSYSLNTANRFNSTPFGLRWRYAEPPQFTSIKPGRMSVTVKLLGVLDS